MHPIPISSIPIDEFCSLVGSIYSNKTLKELVPLANAHFNTSSIDMSTVENWLTTRGIKVRKKRSYDLQKVEELCQYSADHPEKTHKDLQSRAKDIFGHSVEQSVIATWLSRRNRNLRKTRKNGTPTDIYYYYYNNKQHNNATSSFQVSSNPSTVTSTNTTTPNTTTNTNSFPKPSSSLRSSVDNSSQWNSLFSDLPIDSRKLQRYAPGCKRVRTCGHKTRHHSTPNTLEYNDNDNDNININNKRRSSTGGSSNSNSRGSGPHTPDLLILQYVFSCLMQHQVPTDLDVQSFLHTKYGISETVERINIVFGRYQLTHKLRDYKLKKITKEMYLNYFCLEFQEIPLVVDPQTPPSITEITSQEAFEAKDLSGLKPQTPVTQRLSSPSLASLNASPSPRFATVPSPQLSNPFISPVSPLLEHKPKPIVTEITNNHSDLLLLQQDLPDFASSTQFSPSLKNESSSLSSSSSSSSPSLPLKQASIENENEDDDEQIVNVLLIEFDPLLNQHQHYHHQLPTPQANDFLETELDTTSKTPSPEWNNVHSQYLSYPNPYNESSTYPYQEDWNSSALYGNKHPTITNVTTTSTTSTNTNNYLIETAISPKNLFLNNPASVPSPPGSVSPPLLATAVVTNASATAPATATTISSAIDTIAINATQSLSSYSSPSPTSTSSPSLFHLSSPIIYHHHLPGDNNHIMNHHLYMSNKALNIYQQDIQ